MKPRNRNRSRAATAWELAWATEAFAKAAAFDRLSKSASAKGAQDWATHFSRKATALRWSAGQARQGLGIDTSGIDSLISPGKGDA
jgi:hypothetical protein